MGRMGYIHYLCENDDRKELIEELGSTKMADGFLEAHREMRLQTNNKAFDKLNEIVDESVKEVEQNVNKAKESSKGVKQDLDMLFKDIKRGDENVVRISDVNKEIAKDWKKDKNTMQEDEKLSYKDEHICPHGNSKADNCYECDEEESLSPCCSAKIIYHDICSLCKEHV